MKNKIHSTEIHTHTEGNEMACESTHLHFFLTSCLANTSIATFLFWCSPKPSSNIKLPLQLAPAALPPHQVSNSIPVSQESFAWSHFLSSILSNWSIAMFQAYYQSLFSFRTTVLLPPYYLTIWVFITHQYWNFSAFQPSPPRSLLPPFQWDKWLLSCLKARCVFSSSATLSNSWTCFESYIGTSSPGKW